MYRCEPSRDCIRVSCSLSTPPSIAIPRSFDIPTLSRTHIVGTISYLSLELPLTPLTENDISFAIAFIENLARLQMPIDPQKTHLKASSKPGPTSSLEPPPPQSNVQLSPETDVTVPELLQKGTPMTKVTEWKRKKYIFRIDPDEGRIIYSKENRMGMSFSAISNHRPFALTGIQSPSKQSKNYALAQTLTSTANNINSPVNSKIDGLPSSTSSMAHTRPFTSSLIHATSSVYGTQL